LISDSVAAGLGGTFNQPGFALNYVMELVNTVTGAIDTVDRVRFSPCTGEIVIPGSISVTNGGLLAKDVYLRVRQSLSGFTPDSLNSRMFSEITSPSMYPSFSDTSFVFYKRAGKASGSAKQSPLFTNIYPNPIRSGESELNVLFSYPQGYPVTIEMFDQTGKQVTDKLVIESTGENQRVVVMPPKASGAYFVRITAGSCNETYAFSVLH
jgi:hypothetical protein